MNTKRNAPLRRAVLACAVPLALLAAGCSTLAPGPSTTTWTAVTNLVSLDQATGRFVRQGIAQFPDGAVALQRIDGQFTAPGGTSFDAKVAYRFEDGSTLVHEGKGQMVQEGGKTLYKGSSTVVSGSGRFAGATGTVTSSGRALSPNDMITEFRGQLTTPSSR